MKVVLVVMVAFDIPTEVREVVIAFGKNATRRAARTVPNNNGNNIEDKIQSSEHGHFEPQPFLQNNKETQRDRICKSLSSITVSFVSWCLPIFLVIHRLIRAEMTIDHHAR